jgi:H+/Cl- antiporter ClcA
MAVRALVATLFLLTGVTVLLVVRYATMSRFLLWGLAFLVFCALLCGYFTVTTVTALRRFQRRAKSPVPHPED